jgi:Flp pilus assembly secretin CpaC
MLHSVLLVFVVVECAEQQGARMNAVPHLRAVSGQGAMFAAVYTWAVCAGNGAASSSTEQHTSDAARLKAQ